MLFPSASGAAITKQNVVSIHYLQGFKHITLCDKGKESIENQHIFEDASGKGLWLGFWSIWDQFWELFGTLLVPT